MKPSRSSSGNPERDVLRPGQSAPTALDTGKHRTGARAVVDTQLGRRPVGTLDQILAVARVRPDPLLRG